MLVSTVLALIGIWIAYSLFYKRGLEGEAKMRGSQPTLATTLENKWYVDEFYGVTVVRPLHHAATFSWRVIDAIIDGIISLGAYFIAAVGDLLRFFQTGNVRNYALALFLGVIVFIWITI
ncbi:MAG: hypothetical protein KY432_10735 [Acidobacteria bacterium]|nr:hypothetical protein [Acidobacteriota bacterium]